LAIIGLLFAVQFNEATHTATQLLTIDVVKKIKLRIAQVYKSLKRYPDSGDEFETLVLNHLDFSHYPVPIWVKNYVPGNSRKPAFFQVLLNKNTARGQIRIDMEYYGNEYHNNTAYKGNLRWR